MNQTWTPHPSEALFNVADRMARRSASTRRRRLVLIVGPAMLGIAIAAAAGAPLIAGQSPIAIDVLHPLAPPLTSGRFLGTDQYGRDIFSRILYGGRIDMAIAFGATSVTLVFGTIVGLTAGYLGGWVDNLLMRIVDLFFAFPFLVLIIAIIAMIGPSIFNMFVAIWITSWVSYARIMRAQTAVAKKQQYVLAARALGYSRPRVMFRHILPNTASAVIVFSRAAAARPLPAGRSWASCRGTLSSGEVTYHPRGDANLLRASQRELQRLRGAHLAMIFQDPMTALNPVRDIGDQLIEAVTAHAAMSREQARTRAISLLVRVGIPAPGQRMRDYPFQLSGGMLQRVLIAIALASEPRLLLADEPTTSLDVIIQDQILSLPLELQRDTGMSMILVSHDLAVVTEVCDRTVVMYGGQIVEEGDTAALITAPRHPCTRALLDALPQGGERGQLRGIPGPPPSLIDPPAGCRFAPRCPLAAGECRSWDTELLEADSPRHQVRCRRHEEVGRSRAWRVSDSA